MHGLRFSSQQSDPLADRERTRLLVSLDLSFGHGTPEAKKRKARAGRAPHIRVRSREPTGGRFPVPPRPAQMPPVSSGARCSSRHARNIRWHSRFAPPHSRCRSLPKIIIMESRMDANAINHSKQKRKSASWAGAAYPHEPGGRSPVPHRPAAACSRVMFVRRR